jgi:dienelactone hydrolase
MSGFSEPPGGRPEEVKVTRREKVSFASGTVSCAGYLFFPEPQPDADERLPCVVLAHGYSGTMDRLVPHAERFAAGGIAALVFDYRSFGESGGQPRQVVDLPGQHEDIRAAIAWFGDVTTSTPTGWRYGATPSAVRTSSRSRPTTPGSLPWSPRSHSTASPDASRVAPPVPRSASLGPSSGTSSRDGSTSSPSTSRWSVSPGSWR